MTRSVLITGATSKVGEYLTLNLLSRTEARLWIFIRKLPDARNVEERFWSIYRGKVSTEIFQKRIRIIPADLTKRSLGLADRYFHELETSGVDQVFHLAQFSDRPNFSKDSLFAVNYHGTRRVLQLGRRLGATAFTHRGFIYAGRHLSVEDGYLDFLENHSDFHNLNEFVHRMTMSLVIRQCTLSKINYRIFNPGYLIDVDVKEPAAHGQWYSYVLDPIVRLSSLYALHRTPLCLPAAADQTIAMTSHKFVADVMTQVMLDKEFAGDHIVNVYSEKRSVRQVFSLICREIDGLELQFRNCFDDLPWMERKIFEKSFVFFEYLLNRIDIAPDPFLAMLCEKHHLRPPQIKDEHFLALLRAFRSERDRVRSRMSTLIRLHLLARRLLPKRKAA